MNTFNLLFALLLFSSSLTPGHFEDEIRESLSYDGSTSEINPRFVPLIMTRDPYIGDESDGEEDDAFAYFDFEDLSDKVYKGQWREIPFYLASDIPGKLKSVVTKRPTAAMMSMVDKFASESFGMSSEESLRESSGRVALNVMGNRLLSISRSRNYSHFRLVAEGEDSDDEIIIDCNSSYYHIVPTWKERTIDRDVSKERIVKCDRVAKFFRTWKAWEQSKGVNLQSDLSAACQFRRHYESGFGSIVPFQSFRNALLTHKATKDFVRQFYQKEPHNPVYLLYFDDDFGSLRPFGVGLLSLYERFIRYKYEQTGELATIISTAYRFATQPDISIVASEMDRWVRAATASIMPTAVCYPEPNMAILAKNPALFSGEILRARFDESKNGKSKTESRDFIRDALRVKDAKEETIHFLPYGPLPTETPQRVINKSRAVDAELNEDGFIKNWDNSALVFLRRMPQSHLEARDWAQGVVASIKLKGQIKPSDFGLPITSNPLKVSEGGQYEILL